jgi:hypothetical protein
MVQGVAHVIQKHEGNERDNKRSLTVGEVSN